MDETLVTAAIDLSGRPFCVWNAEVPLETLGHLQRPAGGGVLAGGRRRPARSTCTSSCTTAATRITSSRASSRRRPGPCVRRSSPTRAGRACRPPRESSDPWARWPASPRAFRSEQAAALSELPLEPICRASADASRARRPCSCTGSCFAVSSRWKPDFARSIAGRRRMAAPDALSRRLPLGAFERSAAPATH